MGRFSQYLTFAIACLLCSGTASAYHFGQLSSNSQFYTVVPVPADTSIYTYSGPVTEGAYLNSTRGGARHSAMVNRTDKRDNKTFSVAIGSVWICPIGYMFNGQANSSAACIPRPPEVCPVHESNPEFRRYSGNSTAKPPQLVCDSTCQYILVSPGGQTGTQADLGITVYVNGATGNGYSWNGKYKKINQECQDATPNVSPHTTSDWNIEGHTITVPDIPSTNQPFEFDHTPLPELPPSGSCTTSPQGNFFCVTSGDATTGDATVTPPASPPAPDNGTPAQPAKPLVVAVSGNAAGDSLTSTSLYTPDQVAGSTTTGGGTTGNTTGGTTGTTTGDTTGSTTGSTTGTTTGGTTGSTTGDTGGDGDDEGDEEGEGDCEEQGNCTDGENNFDGEVGDVKGFTDALSDFMLEVSASPIFTAFSSVGSAIPTGGTPPSATFEIFNRSYTLQVPPEMIVAMTAVLSLVMKCVWSLIAIRRFMQA